MKSLDDEGKMQIGQATRGAAASSSIKGVAVRDRSCQALTPKCSNTGCIAVGGGAGAPQIDIPLPFGANCTPYVTAKCNKVLLVIYSIDIGKAIQQDRYCIRWKGKS